MNNKVFLELVFFLRKHDYEVEVTTHGNYLFARVGGNNIFGGFCSDHDPNSKYSSNIFLNGMICIDHVETFNKWRQCPLVYDIPHSSKERAVLLDRLQYWGTEDGREKSSDFISDENNRPIKNSGEYLKKEL